MFAAGLTGANVTVLNGADGLDEIAAGLVSQGLTARARLPADVNGSAGGAHQAVEDLRHIHGDADAAVRDRS
jgi:hypothetical protein